MNTSSTTRAAALVLMTAADVSVLIDARDGALPHVVHWGPALPALGAANAAAIVAAAVPVSSSNNVAAPPRPALLTEHHTGWTGRPGLSGSFDGRGWSPRFTVSGITMNNAPIDGYQEVGAGLLSFTAADESGDLTLRLSIELDDNGLLRTRGSLTNLGTDPYRLEDLNLSLPVPGEATEILDFTGLHNLERIPQRSTLTTGIHLRENRKGRTGADSAFVLHVGEPGFGFEHGRVWGIHAAWSGNHRHYAERVFTGEQVIGGGEVLLPGEIVLETGDSYETPYLYGSYGVGLDAVAHRFHKHLRARTRSVSADRPVTLNVWEAIYFDQNQDQLLDLADRAADVGVERFVLDDGWFGARRNDVAGLGDWVVAGDVWPDGLHPLVDHVHELGMQFGLWFEPEMVNLDSDVARAHPEWIMAARGELPVVSRNQYVLNLSHPDAYKHVKTQMLAMLAEYRIDYIKWDHNRDLIEAGDPTRRGRAAVHAQTLAVYNLLAELRSVHPGLEIEACSSGGGRADLGVLEHTDRVWVSDNIDPHDRQSILRWSGQLLPPEFMGAHIASGRSHVTGRSHDLSFRAGTAIFGHLGIEWDLAQASAEEITELKSWVAFHKEHRQLLLDGTLVRLDTPAQIFAQGVVSRDSSRAIFSVAQLDSNYPDPCGPIKLRGLRDDVAYHVRPVFSGPSTSGLHAPAWWGTGTSAGRPVEDNAFRYSRFPDVSFPGATFLGAALQTIGLASPRIHPDQVTIYSVEQVS